MLEPSHRRVYWEPLAPPPGYSLDLAVGTTYSLDLQALLMAMIPLAFGSLNLREDGLPDQVQALASLQRVARRTTVFCQQAQISEPGRYSRLFTLLEPVVAEVVAPHGGVFHPKMWLVRYTAENEPARYRLVVLSRNLTLDRSWDTMFVANGWDGYKQRNSRRPLVDFVGALPGLCAAPLDEGRRGAIEGLAQELWGVGFERPEGVSRHRHHLIGVDGYSRAPLSHATRRMVLSPFLSDRTVLELLESVNDGILISRADSLDALQQETVERLPHCDIFYWLDDVAEEAPDDEIREAAPGHEPDAGEALYGLHAKIIVSECDSRADLLIGSANATDAAFSGHNVEFGARLHGRVEDIGIARILPEEDESTGQAATLRSFLAPYRRDESFVPPTPPPHEQELRDLRRDLVRMELGLAVEAVGDDTWNLRVMPGRVEGSLPSGLAVQCRPVSLGSEARLRDAAALWRGEAVAFEQVSLETLTTFMVFELTAGETSKRLVMNLPIRRGAMPEQREDRLIARMIADSDGFVRYLLMLLWNEDEVEPGPPNGSPWPDGAGRGRRPDGIETLPLLEELVRTFSRHPERLDEIAELVGRLRTTEEGRRIVPEEFMQLWKAFEAARGDAGG